MIIENMQVLHRSLNDYVVEKDTRKVSLEPSSGPGRPVFDIPKHLLEFYVEHRFTIKDIAKMLGVSERTIKRRLKKFNIRIGETYDCLEDTELDSNVLEILRNFPNTGYKKMKGYLTARNFKIQEYRIRDSMRRVDPEGVALRALQSRIIVRRKYSVAGPLSLWHMDGNHKLIR